MSLFNLSTGAQAAPSVISVTNAQNSALSVSQTGAGAIANFVTGSNTAVTIDNLGNMTCAATISSGTGMMFRNKIINGDMRINQRGTSTNLASMTAIGATYGYVTDRWGVYRSAYTTGAQIAQGINLTTGDLPFTNAGIKNFARISRISGNTSTAAIITAYGLESQDCYSLVGQYVTLSFYYRTGANFSGTILYSAISTGTGTDEGYQRGTGFTNITGYTKTNSPSTNWTYVTYTVQLGSNINQIALDISYTPSGTAGANDYFDVTGVQLERGTVATPFELRPYGVELQLCQRYYEIIGPQYIKFNGTYGNGGYMHYPFYSKVSKRTTPTGNITSANSGLSVWINTNDYGSGAVFNTTQNASIASLYTTIELLAEL